MSASPNPYPQVRLLAPRLPQHPAIFRRALQADARLAPGSVVDLVDDGGRFLARGFWNGHARIGLRVLTRDAHESIDSVWIGARVKAAMALRAWLGLDEAAGALRLIHAEGDGLPGLVVDRYADLLVIEYFAAGMWKLRGAIEAALLAQYPAATLYHFAETHVQKQESFDCRPAPIPAPRWIREHDLEFQVQPGIRHKTGFFVDQREHRARLGAWATGRMLDLCCNSGGFALNAARAGCTQVIGVDLDAEVLQLARSNAERNALQAEFVAADVFAYLEQALAAGQRWDTVVLDPAKLTRDAARLPQALRTYVAMNALAMRALAPGGLLLSCSCTGLVDEAAFLEALRRAAALVGRDLQILHVGGAGADHPWRVAAPEGRYLKTVFARVG
jgi:23S rRNA (cytosine1962-C5)-methyltransferase